MIDFTAMPSPGPAGRVCSAVSQAALRGAVPPRFGRAVNADPPGTGEPFPREPGGRLGVPCPTVALGVIGNRQLVRRVRQMTGRGDSLFSEMENMFVLVLLGVLALVVGGCVCVVWAERGGPRWVRAVASVTLAAGELLRQSDRSRSRSMSRTGGDGD